MDRLKFEFCAVQSEQAIYPFRIKWGYYSPLCRIAGSINDNVENISGPVPSTDLLREGSFSLFKSSMYNSKVASSLPFLKAPLTQPETLFIWLHSYTNLPLLECSLCEDRYLSCSLLYLQHLNSAWHSRCLINIVTNT